MDKTGNQARATIVFTVMNSNIVVANTVYAYDRVFTDEFYNSNGCKGVPRLIKSEGYALAIDNLDEDYDAWSDTAFGKQKPGTKPKAKRGTFSILDDVDPFKLLLNYK